MFHFIAVESYSPKSFSFSMCRYVPLKTRFVGGKVLRAFRNDLSVLLKYTQLFPLCFAVFVSMLGFGLVMPLLPIYARDFGATGIQLGFLTASFAATRAISTLPGGWLADKMGRKKPITVGLLLYSVVMALYGFSQDVNQLILLRALQGVASGIVWPVISTMVVDIVPPQDRAKALGLYETMWFLGHIVGPGLGGVLAGAFTIAVPFFACGGLAFVTTILVTLTVRETIPTAKGIEALRAEVNPSPKLDSDTSAHISLRGIRQLTEHPRTFLGLCAARFIIALSSSLIQPLLSVYANEVLGISEVGVGMLFTFMGIVTLFTTLPMGTVADNIGRKPMLLLGKSIEAVSALLVIFSGSFWPLLLVMALRGLGRATINPSITAMFSSVVPASNRGKGMGVFNSFQNVGLVVGAAAGGFLFEYSSTETPFVACTTVGLIGVVLVLLMVSEPKQRLEER